MEERGYRLKNFKNPKAFIEHSQTIDDVYEILTVKQRKERFLMI